jgi:hypothetical protein
VCYTIFIQFLLCSDFGVAACSKLADFKAVDSGGDGAVVQYCMFSYQSDIAHIDDDHDSRVCRLSPTHVFRRGRLSRDRSLQARTSLAGYKLWPYYPFTIPFPRSPEWCPSAQWFPSGIYLVCAPKLEEYLGLLNDY